MGVALFTAIKPNILLKSIKVNIPLIVQYIKKFIVNVTNTRFEY